MLTVFLTVHPVLQALLAGMFTWGLTACGAGCVFLTKEFNRRMLAGTLGFAGGVMIAASFWSLLAPAIELSVGSSFPPLFLVLAGFFSGGLFLQVLDRALPHLHIGFPDTRSEGPPSSLQRTTKLIIAMTIHNIPEGLAVGVAFGAVAAGFPGASVAAAAVLAVGIGIQNFPEGLAISIPLHGEGYSRWKSFWYGQLSGVVEPIAALFGAAVVLIARQFLPFALAFAAGAMIFVVIEGVMPESQIDGYHDLASSGFLLGFALMMLLDVSLA